MAKFKLRNVEQVDAVILTRPIVIDGETYVAGDYMVTTASGDMFGMRAYDFGIRYEPVIPRGRKPKAKGEVETQPLAETSRIGLTGMRGAAPRKRNWVDRRDFASTYFSWHMD